MPEEQLQPQARSTVSVTFRDGVPADDLHKTLDAVINLVGSRHGCENRCGVNGFDIVLHGSDPIQEGLRTAVREIDAVLDISVVEGRATTV